MARLNTATHNPTFTHEGGPAVGHLKPIAQLRRSVLSCLLWENEFYEDGKTIADRIEEVAAKVSGEELASLAIEARKVHNLRHVPLLLLCSLVKHHPHLMAQTTERVISRADELAELLAVYWRKGRVPVDRQLRKGLARAFAKFDEYSLAKYNRDKDIKLRDVLRIARPKPGNDEQSALWRRVKEGKLVTPDTWEVALSGGKDKKETFERMLREGTLGYFALLRNLRNMAQAGVDDSLVKQAIVARKNGAQKILPFRYVAAARAAPQFEREIDEALCAAINELPPLSGTTVVLIDVSGSMDWAMSGKSDLKRMDAAAALGAIVPGDVRLFTFSNSLVEVPPRRGMAGVDVIVKSQPHGSTQLGGAVAQLNGMAMAKKADRLIVITDEQSQDRVGVPTNFARRYMINVASNKNGVGYGGWVHIDGFSEGVLRYILEIERAD